MKNFLGKIWVPVLLVGIAAIQSFGIDAGRAVAFRRAADSLALTDSAAADTASAASFSVTDTISSADTLLLADSLSPADSLTPADSLAYADSLPAADSIAIDSLILNPRDTIKVPDSLRETDPFKFKYYIAIRDSATRVIVRDSLIQAGDSIELHMLDSLYIKDSTDMAKAKFDAWYRSLSKRERKKYDYEQALPGKIAAQLRKMEIKDSIKAVKDSIVQATPRILETFAFPEDMHYKRIVTWKHDRYFHNLKDLRDQSADSSYNRNFHEYPFYNEDINATWLGVAGSPAQMYNYFKREEEENAIFYTPYRMYSFSPESLPQFNTKTPYTELCYWGTLFANKEKEEANIRVLTTQNILPELNLTLAYQRFGGNGMLRREKTDNRNAVIALNYTGKKYLMHAGYIYNKVERNENGGIVDNFWIRDTTVDAREIEVNLQNASNKIKKNTLFLDQSYRIPFDFINDLKGRKEKKAKEAFRDSIMNSGDSTAIEQLKAEIEQERTAEELRADTAAINTDITTAFIGHSSEYSVIRKTYEDNITDEAGRAFYHDRFYLNPTTSKDSLRVMKFENRLFIRLQPWADDAIVSKIDAGIGDKLVNYFTFKPIDYLKGSSNEVMNSVYMYAGANGQYKNYLSWNALGRYTFAGYEANDFSIEANATFKAYPFRRDRESPLQLDLRFKTSLKEPDYYQQHLITNHYKWDNDFGKISETKTEARLSIPRWDLDASVGYALLNNNIYYDTLGIVRQNTKPMSVLTAAVRKDFTLWKFHLDHKAMLQLSSDKDVMPLPLLALNFRYYLQFDVVKDVMQMQIGAHALFTTKWNAPAYNPVLGVFFNQQKHEYGECPYIDLFVNMQWKRVSLFVKVVNINMGWPNKSADYFTADGYIATQRAIKFGITWPFYVFPGTKSAGATASGGKSGGRPGGNPGGRR